MTCTSLTAICLAPPTLMVSLRTGSATFAAISERGAFAVNLLAELSQETAELFSSSSEGKFTDVPWKTSEAGLPWLVSVSVAAADCTVVRTLELGDHTATFGEVRTVSFTDDWPLLYGLRSYAKWRFQNHHGVANGRDDGVAHDVLRRNLQ